MMICLNNRSILLFGFSEMRIASQVGRLLFQAAH